MKIRYNIFTKFFVEKNNIIIKIIGQDELLIQYDEKLYTFLLLLEEKIFITKEDISKSGINNYLIELFYKFNILVEYKNNTGIESYFFNQFIKNPNQTTENIDVNEINNIYQNVEKGISEKLNFESLKKFSLKKNKLNININNNKEKQLKYRIKNLLNRIKSIKRDENKIKGNKYYLQ